MLVMTNEITEKVEKEYQLFNFDFNECLSVSQHIVDEVGLRELVSDILSSKYARFPKEFSRVLLNSNFTLSGNSVVPGSLCIDILDVKPDTMSEIVDIPRNSIDLLATLSRMEGFIVFKHNRKKILSRGDFGETSLFADNIVQFLNKVIAVPLRKLKVYESVVYVEYCEDGENYRFEVASLCEDSLKLAEFDVKISTEDYQKIEKLFILDDVRMESDSVLFKVTKESIGPICFEISEHIATILSALVNQKYLLCLLKDTLNIIKNNKFPNFETKSFKSNRGIPLTEEFLFKKMSQCEHFLVEKELSYIDSNNSFVAMIELGQTTKIFNLKNCPNELNRHSYVSVIECLCKNRHKLDFISVDELEKQINVLDFYVLKFIGEYVKSTKELDSIWLSTSFGQTVIEFLGGGKL